MNTTTIQKAEIGDFLSIAELDREAWKENLHAEFIPDGEHAWRIWVEHALVYCAKNQNDIVGAILAFPTIYNYYCIHKVFVEKNYRKCGIGTRLIAALLKEIDSYSIPAFLTVDPANERAKQLYFKWGFINTNYVNGYYRKYEDRLVLTRSLLNNDLARLSRASD